MYFLYCGMKSAPEYTLGFHDEPDRPKRKRDVEQYFAEGRFERNIRLRRRQLGPQQGRGHPVCSPALERPRGSEVTAYGVSYTDREETEPDPDKDSRFKS